MYSYCTCLIPIPLYVFIGSYFHNTSGSPEHCTSIVTPTHGVGRVDRLRPIYKLIHLYFMRLA